MLHPQSLAEYDSLSEGPLASFQSSCNNLVLEGIDYQVQRFCYRSLDENVLLFYPPALPLLNQTAICNPRAVLPLCHDFRSAGNQPIFRGSCNLDSFKLSVKDVLSVSIKVEFHGYKGAYESLGMLFSAGRTIYWLMRRCNKRTDPGNDKTSPQCGLVVNGNIFY
jgi:hypothetical protein